MILNAALTSTGLLLIKKGFNTNSQELSPFANGNTALFLGITVYGASFVTWLFVIKHSPLSVAYPIVVGLTTVFTLILSKVVENEVIKSAQIISTFIVIAGIIGIVRATT